MSEIKVGVRELRSRLSQYLRRVKAGETVLVTEHGRPVGRIVSAQQTANERLQGMVEAGLVLWSGRKLASMPPVARPSGDTTVAELLVEDRG